MGIFSKKTPMAQTQDLSAASARVAPRVSVQPTKVVPRQLAAKPAEPSAPKVDPAREHAKNLGGVGAVKMPTVVAPRSVTALTASARLTNVLTTDRKVRTSSLGKQIGQLLLAGNKITETQLERALESQKEHHGLLGQILVQKGACQKPDVAAAIKEQRTITTVNLSTAEFDLTAVTMLEQSFCENRKVVPFEACGTQLCIAMSNALDTMTKSEIKERTGMHVKIFDASNIDIQNAIKKYFAEVDKAQLVVTAKSSHAETADDSFAPVFDVPDAPSDETLPPRSHAGDMPSIAETLRDIELSTAPLPVLPVGPEYRQATIENGITSPELRWLAAVRDQLTVPAIPA